MMANEVTEVTVEGSGLESLGTLRPATPNTTNISDPQISREIHFERVTENAQYFQPITETHDAANVRHQDGSRDITSATTTTAKAIVPQHDPNDTTATN